jgi:hypothetical protein
MAAKQREAEAFLKQRTMRLTAACVTFSSWPAAVKLR